jgi:hypothetical protein
MQLDSLIPNRVLTPPEMRGKLSIYGHFWRLTLENCPKLGFTKVLWYHLTQFNTLNLNQVLLLEVRHLTPKC